MARQTVLVGKIGPAFNGAEIRGHGSAATTIHPENWVESRAVRMSALDVLILSIADNMTQHDAYRFDAYTNDGIFR